MHQVHNRYTGEIRQTDGETIVEDGETYLRTIKEHPNGKALYGPDGVCVHYTAPVVTKEWVLAEEWET